MKTQGNEKVPGIVRFDRTEAAYDGFVHVLREMIEREGCGKVLDVGGGAQPMLSVEYVQQKGLEYTVLDISEEELARAPGEYRKVVGDIAGSGVEVGVMYDLVFSRFMAEHVRDARQLHQNVFDALRPGGIAFHFFPTLFALPFLVNWLLPEAVAVFFLPKARRQRGKFAAYYQWCVGPSAAAIARFSGLGYEVVEYAGFFGHGYYDGIPVLRTLHGEVRKLLLRRPVTALTSFAWVILKKPDDGAVTVHGKKRVAGPGEAKA